MSNRGVEHHHHNLEASSSPVVEGLLLARHLHNQQQQPSQIAPPLDDDNQRGRNQAHHLPSFGEHPWDNPPSLRLDPPPLPQHRQSSQARGESDDDRAPLDDAEGDNEASHCSSPGGGRLAIAFLLNPSGAGAATTSTATTTSTSTSASAGGHKRKADDDHPGRTSGSSFPAPQVAASRGGGGGAAAEREERDDDADDRQLRRRRLEQQFDEPPPAIEGDARYSLHQGRHQPHQHHQHPHQQQQQHTHYQRAVLPSLSSIIATASPPSSSSTATATMSTDLYHTPHHLTSPQRSSPPSPGMMPSPSTRALPAGGFSPFHSPAPSPAASGGTSFGMGLSLADPSFFFHSFNCLPSAMSARMDSEPEPPPPPPGSSASSSSSSSSADSSAGFYYTPYERSQSAPSSPKLFVGDDAGLPEGEEAEEDYGAPPRQGTTTALTPEQLQLRLQTQALQTQLLVRQMQRKQSVQQLKRLHAQQRRQRFEVHSASASASASFASSPSRAGEGGRKRGRGSRGRGGGEFDDDADEDGYNDENGASSKDEYVSRSEKRSAFEQHHNPPELMARKLEDKLKLLREKIMDAGDSVEGGGGDGCSSSSSAKGGGASGKMQQQQQEKRKRATPQQLKLLEEVFSVDPFPAREAKQLLAQKLGMSIRSITIWFQNKRARLKKFGEKSGTM